MDWDELMGQAYTGTGTQWDWYTMELDSMALGYIATTPLPSLIKLSYISRLPVRD